MISIMSPSAKGIRLGWIGSAVAVYADEDPFWKELAAVTPDKLEGFLQDNAWRLPVAVRFDVSSGLRLTAFLTAFGPTSSRPRRHDPLEIACLQRAALRENHADPASKKRRKNAGQDGHLLCRLRRCLVDHAQ